MLLVHFEHMRHTHHFIYPKLETWKISLKKLDHKCYIQNEQIELKQVVDYFYCICWQRPLQYEGLLLLFVW